MPCCALSSCCSLQYPVHLSRLKRKEKLFNMFKAGVTQAERMGQRKHSQYWKSLFVCVCVSVFADRAAARTHSDPVPGMAGSRRSWWLHGFPGLRGSGPVQTGGTGSAHGGALQVRDCRDRLSLFNACIFFQLFSWSFYLFDWFGLILNVIAVRALDGQEFWSPWRRLCV